MQTPDSTLKTEITAIRSPSELPGIVVRRLIRSYKIWSARRRATKALTALSDRLLADAGIDRCDIADIVDKAVRAEIDDSEHRVQPSSRC